MNRGILIGRKRTGRKQLTAYQGVLRIEGETDPGLHVEIDLTDHGLSMMAGDQEVASWSRDEMRISALPDGFHIRAEGEAIILDVTDDAHFAVELGLRNAHPALLRKMSALIREDRADDYIHHPPKPPVSDES